MHRALFPKRLAAMKTRSLLLALTFLLASTLPRPATAENEIGFIERFALAPDRERVLGELVPGSEDYYFYHALHYQNTRHVPKYGVIMEQWKKRFPNESQRRRVIENREALLEYDAAPQATLKYLKDQLNIRHDHQQEVRDRKPDLPTALEAARIARNVFLADSLAQDGGLEGFSQEALATLVREKVTMPPQQRRALLQKLERPDVPGLVDLVVQQLQSRETRGFGEFPIYRALLPDQLDALAQALPNLIHQQAYVHTRLRKLAPSADTNLEFDDAEREAWLDRVWAYAQKLPEAHNTLKSRILYLRLDHDRKKGIYDRARLMEYVKLPRQLGYVNPRFIQDALEARQRLCDLNADLSDPLLSAPPIRNDEPLVREYFLRLFSTDAQGAEDPDAAMAAWTPYVRDTWLKPVLAEAMIVGGIGNAERWASLLTPTAFQQLKERVDIEFPATNAKAFLPGDDVQFDVVVKNTPKLIVKIFELNTLNFFQTQRRQLNTDLNLDGLVANSEKTHNFESGPFLRTRQAFEFPELKGRRGAWIIEFIGGGRSSRALVRVGQWQVLQQPGPSGDLLLVLDEKNKPVPDAVAWLDGRKLTRDEKLGRIVAPFTTSSGKRPVIIGDAAGTFATLTTIERHQEDYQLDAQFYLEREQLLARRQATLAVRTSLMLGETHLAPELLTEPKLSIMSTTHDGISTTSEVRDLKLSAGSVLTHTLTVPERLRTLKVSFSAKVDVLSTGGEKRDVTAEHTWIVNGMDQSEAVNDGHLSKFGDSYAFDLLGKNGEPVADQQVIFTFKHRDFARTQTIALRTDEKGRVRLGPLADIAQVTAKCPNGRVGMWALDAKERTFTSTLHARSGEVVRIPAGDEPEQVSLLSMRAGTFTADHSAALSERDGFLVIDGLAPGDYSLRFAREPRIISIKVTAGEPAGGWLLGKHRRLEVRNTLPLHITGMNTDNEFITVKLANSSLFTRVHVAATRFDPGRGLFDGLGDFTRFGVASGTPARLPNLYSAGREIGDEYRYILERRYAKLFPGNMLTRPGLLLNPWETRHTDLEELAQRGGEGASATTGTLPGHGTVSPIEPATPVPPQFLAAAADTNIDFLADSAPVIYNLVPDKDGVVRVERKSLGDRQHVQVYAEDLQNASWRSFALPETAQKLADQRLARNLDPAKPFTQRKDVTVLEQGKALTLADILTSKIETYDTLGGIYSLFTTLSSDPNLTKFAFVLRWPTLRDEEKRAKYGEFACHELNFFLARKDKPFFDSVIKPYLANKKDKTFMDDFLLGRDLKPYLEPWAYSRLNVVERCLLAQRIEGEAPNAARHLRELWEMIPPNPEEQDRLFETALTARSMEESTDQSVAGALEAERLGADSTRFYVEKMQKIIFPHLRFQGASVEEAIEYLRIKSRDYDTEEGDPAKKGISMIIKPGAAPSTAQITLDLKDVPMSEALKYITDLGGMRYKVEPYAVVVVPLSDITTDMYTRTYKVPPDFMKVFGTGNETTARQVLEANNVPFPEGAAASFVPATSQLVVRNTMPALDQIEALTDELNKKAPSWARTRGSQSPAAGGAPAASPAPATDPFAPAPPPMPALRVAADPFAPAGAAPAIAGAMMKPARALTVDEMRRLAEAPEAEAKIAGRGAERVVGMVRGEGLSGRVFGVNEDSVLDNGIAKVGTSYVYFGRDALEKDRASYRSLFRALGPTKEWAENNYYELRIAEQKADLVTVNAFWRDYAAWIANGSKGAFVSANVAEAGRDFTEMMLALAVLDLPFDAPKHLTKTDAGQFTFTAAGPVIVFHKEIKPAPAAAAAQGGLLVSQSFFRVGDRYRQVGNEHFEKYVTEEFLSGAAYGANVVVTNPTSAPVKADVLLQIPQGAMPISGGKPTHSQQVRLEPYTTKTFEYQFYFPAVSSKPGAKFVHFPVNVATSTGATGAKPFEFNVVAKLTQVDKASWDYVSQEGSDADVFTFLAQNNLAALDIERVAWRCRQRVDFYKKLVATLRTHHLWSDPIARYALLHNDTTTLREWLKHEAGFTGQCGPYLASGLVTLDPIERRSYEHLEFSPLVNQRAHRVGNEWRIANPALHGEYTSLLHILAHKPQLDAMDHLSVSYFLFLQDRVEEALTRFKGVDPATLPTKLQHDYLKCYAAFYESNLPEARTIAAKYANHSVPRWKKLFAGVTAQLDEIEGKGSGAKPQKEDKPDRELQQGELASTEPGVDFKVENRTISLAWQNLGEVTMNYYLMDPEFSFSSNPFVSLDAGRFSIIKPTKTATQALPKDQKTLDVALPAEFAKSNVLIEVIGAGQRRTQAYHANTLKLAMTENYGRLETRDSATDKPLAKTYVKVYAKLDDGTVRFYKDGYTDLRGCFDYASLNGSDGPASEPFAARSAAPSGAPADGLDYQMLKPAELSKVQKLAVLVLSDTNGAMVKEVNPPNS
jgi:hypothetical protein